MDILYLLIPLSVLAMLAVLGAFAWALHGGQFDELEAAGQRALLDSDQSDTRQRTEQWPPCH
jgi:cbb3-type cytochrome oxidase maturation protein